MKKLIKKMTIFLAVMMVVTLSVPSRSVKAESSSYSWKMPKKSGTTMYGMIIDKSCANILFSDSKQDNMDVISFKSSKPAVAKTFVTKDYTYKVKDNERKRGGFYLKKPGTAKLTMTYRLNNKVKKMVINLKVIKYTNPLKTFAIDGKNYAKVFNKVTVYGPSYKIIPKAGDTYKFAVKPKKDWKVTSVKTYESKKQLKNAKKITLPKDGTTIEVKVKYKNKKIENLDAFYGFTQ